MSNNKEIKVQQCSDSPQETRRAFIRKFGKLAVITPVAVTTLMSTYSSKAMASTDDGSGDGII